MIVTFSGREEVFLFYLQLNCGCCFVSLFKSFVNILYGLDVTDKCLCAIGLYLGLQVM